MSTGFVLTEADVLIWRQMRAAFLSNSVPLTEEMYTDSAPEVYVAKVPESGMTGLITVEENEVPDVGDGTIRPGEADCLIYKIIMASTDNSVPTLMKVSENTSTVFNLGTQAIKEGYILVHRTKFGKWVSSIAGSPLVLFTLTEDISGTTATATNDEDNEEITIKNTSGIFDTGTDTSQGIGIRDSDGGIEIIHLFQPSALVRFTLTEDVSTSTVAATDDDDGDAVIEVKNTSGIFDDGTDTSKGLGIREPDGTIEIIQLECP